MKSVDKITELLSEIRDMQEKHYAENCKISSESIAMQRESLKMQHEAAVRQQQAIKTQRIAVDRQKYALIAIVTFSVLLALLFLKT